MNNQNFGFPAGTTQNKNTKSNSVGVLPSMAPRPLTTPISPEAAANPPLFGSVGDSEKPASPGLQKRSTLEGSEPGDKPPQTDDGNPTSPKKSHQFLAKLNSTLAHGPVAPAMMRKFTAPKSPTFGLVSDFDTSGGPISFEKKTVWLFIYNIPEGESTQNLGYKVDDVVEWLDYDPQFIQGSYVQLGRSLKCMNWAGDIISVLSDCVRLPKTEFELSKALKNRPRASVITDFVGSSKDELSVKVDETVYLSKDLGNDFWVVDKDNKTGKVPKCVLTVLVPL